MEHSITSLAKKAREIPTQNMIKEIENIQIQKVGKEAVEKAKGYRI